MIKVNLHYNISIKGYIKKKTTSTIFVDNQLNPTTFYTGNSRHATPDQPKLKIPHFPIFQMKFKVSSELEYTSSGFCIQLIDIDTNHSYSVFNDSGFNIMLAAIDGRLTNNNGIVEANLRLVKNGSSTGVELVNSEELNNRIPFISEKSSYYLLSSHSLRLFKKDLLWLN